MTKVIETVRSYFGKVYGGLKRSIYNDDFDNEDDIHDSMSSPPFKKNRFTDTNLETDEKIIRSGSVNTNRISSAHHYSCRTSSTKPYSSSEMSTSKIEKIIPIRIESSVSSNKENAPCGLSSTFYKRDEFTPVTSKYFSVPKFDNQQHEEPSKRTWDPSFTFKPPLTSTAHKPESSEVFSATMRKPIRSPELTPNKRRSLLPKSPKFFKHKILSNFSSRNRITNETRWRLFPTPKESIRLGERDRYKQLIQQQTNSIIAPSRCYRKSPFFSLLTSGLFSQGDIAEKSGAIMKTHLDPRLSFKSKMILEKRESSPVKSPSQIPGEISITRDLSSSKNVPFIDLEPESEINKEIKLDDDLFIIKEIKTPTSTRKNSLENEFQKSVHYSHEWLTEMTELYNDKKKSSDSDVEIMFETKRKCQESREKHEKDLMKKTEDRMSRLDITYPSPYIEATEEEEEVLPELTPEIENIIERAFRGGPPSQVLVEKFNIQIKRKDIHTLAGLNWLNDEVINFYMNLLMERGKNDNYPSVYAFNTFFYSKLLKTGYASIKRWTKKIDIFSHDLLIIPVHLGMHWCLATIDLKNKTIKYYDSMHGNNNTCLVELRKYLESEHLDKKKSSFDVSAFSAENVKDIPQQMNGSDCGMFSCKFAEYLSRNAPITFTQENMPYFRKRMVYEIVTHKLM